MIKAATLGILCLAAAARAGDMIGFGKGQSLDPKDALNAAQSLEISGVASAAASQSAQSEISWVRVEGGRFKMGTESGRDDAKPVHEVELKTFEISRTMVTVEQYGECVAKGRCAPPDTANADMYCNWGKPERRRHPVNCVDWNQADQYAKFKGARLPSESEWEYAARSRGKENLTYPWGDAEPTCARAVIFGNGAAGCGPVGTMPVCSKPAGTTEQGLCDMAGNVWQWVQDKYNDSYADAPADGGAAEGAGAMRVTRGGSFFSKEPRFFQVHFRGRGHGGAGFRFGNIGFRIAR